MSSKENPVTYKAVEDVLNQMLIQGIKPSVRSVIAVTGGKTTTVSQHIKDFFEKRDQQNLDLANEIGSSEIGKLIASEIHLVIEKRTATLHEASARQNKQIEELIEALSDKDDEIEQAHSYNQKQLEEVVASSNTKVEKARSEVSKANKEKNEALAELNEVKINAKNEIKAAQEKAEALVDTAKTAEEKAQQEASTLRNQVKELSIDEAKRQLQAQELESSKQQISKLQLKQSENIGAIAALEAENKGLQSLLRTQESTNQELKSQIQTLLQEVDKLRGENDNNKSLLSSALTDKARLEAEKTGLSNQLASLRQE